MASYTDIIPQFTPYVQETPVQALVEVGMEKQRRYDEGIQRIQSYVDQVAGLPVSRPADRAYLQSKLNELGGKLKTFAAADFSNYQLVNSVNGMTSQLIRDPYITAGVQSAANIRRQEEFINEERKKGNLTPDNEYNYRKALNSYMTSGLSDESGNPIVFNNQYIAHFDVNKYVRETFDAIKPGNWTIEQLYETDQSGNIKFEKIIDPKTKQVVGQRPIVSKIASKLEQEGRLPEEVRGALNQIFGDPRVKQQLRISGEYNYRGYTPEMLVEKVANVKSQQVSGIEERIADLNMRKASTKDPMQAEAFQAAIDKLESDISTIESNYTDTVQAINSNPDAVKSAMYMEEIKDSWTRMYGSIKESRTSDENVLFKVNFELQKEANDLEIKREDMRYKWSSLAETKRKNLKEEQDRALDLKLKYPSAFPQIGAMKLEGVDANIAFDNLYDKGAAVYTAATDNLLFKTFLNNPKNQAAIKRYTSAGMTEEQARAKIVNDFAAKNGESPQDLRARWLVKANNYLSDNPGKLDAVLQDDLIAAQNAQNVFKTLTEAKKKVDAKAPDDYKRLTQSLKPVTVDTRSLFGKLYGAIIPDKVEEWLGMSKGTVTLTPQQQYDLAMAVNGDKVGQSAAVRAEAKRAQERLASQGIDKDTAQIIATNLAGGVTTGSATFDQFLRSSPVLSAVSGIPAVTSAVSAFGGKDPFSVMDPNRRSFVNLSQAIADPTAVVNMEKRAEAIKEFYQFNPVAKIGILTGKEETDKVYRDDVLRFIGSYVQAGVNESPGFLDNAEAMAQIVADKKGSVEMEAKKDEVTGQVKQVLKFYNEKAQFVGEMTIDGYEAATLNKDPSGFFTMPGVKVAEMRFNSTGNGTTSYSGEVTKFDTYLGNDVIYNKDQFPLLRGNLSNNIDVRANISSTTFIDPDGNPSTRYYNHLFINNGGEKMIHTFDTPKPNIDQSIQGLNSINPQLIQKIIAEKKSKK